MGGDFWQHLGSFASETMLDEGVISPEDLDLIHTAETPGEALQIIQGR
jgi:predicted Rossmann-fold nucleotide-binding protein